MSTEFSLPEARAVLERTPEVLSSLLGALPDRLLHADEGPGTWSSLEVLKHLVWAEVDDWIPRIQSILVHGRTQTFRPFDREAGFERYSDWTVDKLLLEFATLRRQNLETLASLCREADLSLEGTHPEFGPLTLQQLIATWATHDMGHLVQIGRVLTKSLGQYTGPWRAYISALRDSPASESR